MKINPKSYQIQKIDRRMNGYGVFSHRINVSWPNDYLLMRDWFFENLGSGCELEYFHHNEQLELGYTWAWITSYGRREIYLNEDQLSAFILYNT